MAPINIRKPYPLMVQDRAKDTPDRTFAIIPKTDSIEDGYMNLTYSQLDRAVNKMSWWLETQLGKSKNFDTIAYMGTSDHRYTFLYLAVMKTRRQVLFPLFNNSDLAMLNLMESTNCQTLLASEERVQYWHNLGSKTGDRQILTVPSFEYFVNDIPVDQYPYSKTWEAIKDDPILILHTSGSTGLPKPIRSTNYMMSIFVKGDFVKKFADKKIIIPMPPSWVLGLYLHATIPLDHGMIPVTLPKIAPLPMTAEYMDRIHVSVSDCAGGVYVPDVLQELVKNPTYISNMRKLQMVAYGGAALAKEAGDILASFTNVISLIGSTELGDYGVIMNPDPKDWEYLQFDLTTGIQFFHFQDDLYESVFCRYKDPKMASKQVIFNLFPELEQYHTRDLWREHETKKGYWMHVGRVDDFVKLSSLTKFNATHIESLLLTNKMVKGVVMGGDARPVPYLLVELADGEDEREALESLWSLIQKINANISTEIGLEKDLILFTSPKKPMLRVGTKNTINRRGTNQLYADEIEEMYQIRRVLLNSA